ncbi:helix-turn-helix domain-containing protein, partial [Hungatella sp.]
MKSGNTPANTYILSSVNNALKILDLLSVRDNIGATEIGRLLELDKSTVFKLLYTLEQRDYVLKTESAKYCLGYKFKNYG